MTDADSVLRAVAAAPPQRAPQRQVTAIVIDALDADARERALELAARFELAASVREDGRCLATVPADRANAAASCALALRRAWPQARVALATGSIDARPSAIAPLVDRAVALASDDQREPAIAIDAATGNLLDARFEVRSAAGVTLLVAERAGAAASGRDAAPDAAGEGRIARAMDAERLVNMRQLLGLVAPVTAANVIRELVFGRTGSTIYFAVAWFVVAISRVAVMRTRPSVPRWMLYSPFFIDLPLVLATNFRSVIAGASPQQNAAFMLCAAVVMLAVAQFVVSPGRVAIIASVLLVAASTAFAIAGQPRHVVLSTIFIGTMVAIAILSQARTKALLRRIAAEADARARDVEAANAELRRQVAERSRDLSVALARLASAPDGVRLAPGDVVDDRYRIVRRIGAGGMGEVYEIERLADGRRLALKTMTGAVHREALARFAREAQLAAELDAPNLVAAVDVGVTRAGTLFLVMELVAGASLAAVRDRYGDARWAVPILAQVARALAVMHGRGIVHRDLKPSNILLDGATAKVSDFGIAGLVGDAPFAASPELTRTGALIGTPLYMAPELARGAREASAATDMFSFGVVAYELLAGQLPHAAPPVLERLAGRAVPAPAPLANVEPELRALVERCLGEAPEARPTAELVAATLAVMARKA
ncbi:MAG: protein kinase domain-containing protein [Acidobacteriota bacterium]